MPQHTFLTREFNVTLDEVDFLFRAAAAWATGKERSLLDKAERRVLRSLRKQSSLFDHLQRVRRKADAFGIPIPLTWWQDLNETLEPLLARGAISRRHAKDSSALAVAVSRELDEQRTLHAQRVDAFLLAQGHDGLGLAPIARRGAPRKNDPRKDAEIDGLVKTHGLREVVSQMTGMTKEEIERAQERHRKALGRKGLKSPQR